MFSNHNAAAAFGGPGVTPRWARADKQGIGTAYSAASRLWFTLWNGIVTEIYYPTIDSPQTRDLQFLVSDGESFVHEEKRDLTPTVKYLDSSALGYSVTSQSPGGRYTLHKQIISDPHQPCLLIRTRLEGEEALVSRLKLYVLCAPHLGGGGEGNNGCLIEAAGRRILTAEKDGHWLALMATCPFSRLSCGYVGKSDGWTDLRNFQMDWEFEEARDGNIALTGEIATADCREFTLGLAFGESRHSAVTTLLQSLDPPFEWHRERFCDQWERASHDHLALEKSAFDSGRLYHISANLLLAHEDKTYPGAMVASLAIPWGELKSDVEGRGGYHLVWTRDMAQSALGLMAAGDMETPRRALIYLAASQESDGSFSQNFRVNGDAYWSGLQLDEIAFPILLAQRIALAGALAGFDPLFTIQRAARYLVLQGPISPQERWEEQSGYSPSTLAACIAACVCAGAFVRQRGEEGAEASASFLEQYADWMRVHLEDWTVTQAGTLLPEVPRHFVRVNPAIPGHPAVFGAVDTASISLTSQPPDAAPSYPAREIVDAGFLELVRLGVLAPDDPLITDSLKVVDAVLKVDTPNGPCWRRYPHDGYGQKDDGSGYDDWGTGRAWPLLTGERGMYELAAGRDAAPYLRTLEAFAGDAALLPEQVWDQPDLPEAFLSLGGATGSARPLLWAHAKYVTLLRSAADGAVFDLPPDVAQRYQNGLPALPPEVWSFLHPTPAVAPGSLLRVIAASPFQLRHSDDDWKTVSETEASALSIGIYYADLPVGEETGASVRFTFFWPDREQWEGQDYCVTVSGPPAALKLGQIGVLSAHKGGQSQ